MVQLVFVHGVATREGSDFSALTQSRDQLFREIAFPKAGLDITTVYWGKDASKAAWNNESLPRYGSDKTKSFGLIDGLLAPEVGSAQIPLAEIARGDFSAAIDALFGFVVDQSLAKSRTLDANELELFLKAGAYAQANSNPPWLRPEMGNSDFVVELRRAMNVEKKIQSFGLGDTLVSAANSVSNRARNLTATVLTATFRDELSPKVATFLGDVFVYLKDGNNREAIRKDISDAVCSLQRKSNEPLVLVGHSMGGVILVDMLLDPKANWLRDVGVDLLLTVGSQPGFFEELKLFQNSDPRIGLGQTKAKAAFPKQVKHWWNVYDPVDFLSFLCAPIFDGAVDFQFSSIAGLLDAHSSYFKRPSFYARLAARLRAEGL